jgi:hypothetical protein
VDKLSGDFRENLTPIQVGACGSTGGQGWDIITSGKHINVAQSMLIVSTLTEACANFDPRRAAGNQVNLFSCGGRGDGGGAVTNSQLFSFKGTGAGSQALQPENAAGSCFTVRGSVVDIAACNPADAQQSFTLVGSGTGGAIDTPSNSIQTTNTAVSVTLATDTPSNSARATAATVSTTSAAVATTCSRTTRSVTVTSFPDGSGAAEISALAISTSQISKQ